MNGKIFWEKRTLKQFRIIFESSEIIVGADSSNRYKTFRKDTGLIAFSRREILGMKLNSLTRKRKKGIKKDEGFNKFSRSGLEVNFA